MPHITAPPFVFSLNLRYWIQSGRPGHLTALIKERPLDFIDLKLISRLGDELGKPDLNQPEAAPVLFHGGCLTLGKITPFPVKDP
jgi:hypothetical protein